MASWTSRVAAILLSLVLLTAGLWKLSDPAAAAVRLAQATVPASFSLAAALTLATAETLAGIMLLIPRLRRWGSILGGLLLLTFLCFIGIHYQQLRGTECSCFPWIKRAVGPQFFLTDGLLLLLALAAGFYSRPSGGFRRAVLLLIAIAAVSAGSLAVNAKRHTGIRAPHTISTMDGHAIPLREGKVFLYFFDPQCLHCLEAGRRLAALNWSETRFVGLPTVNPRFAEWFMGKAGLSSKGVVSGDAQSLKRIFWFDVPPAGVALDHGYEKAVLLRFDDVEPRAALTSLGFVKGG